MKDNIISKIRKDLKSNIDLEYKKGEQNYFKEKIKTYGVRSPIVMDISRRYFKEVKNLEKNQIFKICEELMKSGYTAEIKIALDWSFLLKKQYLKNDFKIFELWLKKYIYNWGNCDDFCGHTLGYFLLEFPEFFKEVKKWAKSKNRWERRASAVILIYPIRIINWLNRVFEIADILLSDEDNLVQKGYGWMLKEASNKYPKEVFNYVIKNKKAMPRTALRYAIEKLPSKLKKEAMKK